MQGFLVWFCCLFVFFLLSIGIIAQTIFLLVSRQRDGLALVWRTLHNDPGADGGYQYSKAEAKEARHKNGIGPKQSNHIRLQYEKMADDISKILEQFKLCVHLFFLKWSSKFLLSKLKKLIIKNKKCCIQVLSFV